MLKTAPWKFCVIDRKHTRFIIIVNHYFSVHLHVPHHYIDKLRADWRCSVLQNTTILWSEFIGTVNKAVYPKFHFWDNNLDGSVVYKMVWFCAFFCFTIIQCNHPLFVFVSFNDRVKQTIWITKYNSSKVLGFNVHLPSLLLRGRELNNSQPWV